MTRVRHAAVVALVALALLGSALAAGSQPAATTPRIGFLVTGTPSSFAVRIEAFRRGLRELGYVEGQSLNIEYATPRGRRSASCPWPGSSRPRRSI